ncbi:hypothetical protein, partial [Nocardia carnea]|uniref:hypothetical protein n=1 Tax=Nocardia carnea TaxID=37328 RepID=UPI00245903FD
RDRVAVGPGTDKMISRDRVAVGPGTDKMISRDRVAVGPGTDKMISRGRVAVGSGANRRHPEIGPRTRGDAPDPGAGATPLTGRLPEPRDIGTCGPGRAGGASAAACSLR